MDNILKAFEAVASEQIFFPCIIEPKNDGTNKTRKTPCDLTGHYLTAWNETKNQTTLPIAISTAKFLNEHGDGRFGVGMAFSDANSLWFIDLDKTLNDAGTDWSDNTKQTLQRFSGALIERSQSGRGLHIYFRAAQPKRGHNNHALGLEVYGHKHFAVITGIDAVGTINHDCTAALQWFLDAYFTEGTAAPSATWVEACKALPHPSHTVIADDDELISLACKSGRGPDQLFTGEQGKFERLWAGDTSGYPSASEADAALAQLLCFWTGNDAERIERLMLRSGLNREKHYRGDYLPRTVLQARGKQTTFYSSNRIMDKSDSKVQSPASQVGLNPLPLQPHQYVQITASGKVVNSTENLSQLLKYYGITARWNDMKHEREIKIPGFSCHLGDAQNATLCKIMDIAGYNHYPITPIDEQLDIIAQTDTYHPIVESMALKPWDGVPRLEAFVNTLQTDNNVFAHRLVKLWMLSSMAAAHSVRGFAQQGLLVLEGNQGIRKTQWIKTLDPIDCDAVKEAAILDPNNKDNIIQHAKHWLVEIGELDGPMRKTDIARFKSHLTTQVDEIRFPYARKSIKIPRRTSYIATVNDPRFLTDPTGNRRFYTISILEMNLDHGL